MAELCYSVAAKLSHHILLHSFESSFCDQTNSQTNSYKALWELHTLVFFLTLVDNNTILGAIAGLALNTGENNTLQECSECLTL